MVHTDCLCHQAWAFVNFLDDISRDWCPDLVRPSRFTFKRARMRKNVCMYSYNKLMIWCDPTPRGNVFFLELWYLKWIPLSHERFLEDKPMLHCSMSCLPEVSHSVATAVSGYPMDAWIAQWEWTPKSAFPIFSYAVLIRPWTWCRMSSKAGCLSRGDVSQHFHLGV